MRTIIVFTLILFAAHSLQAQDKEDASRGYLVEVGQQAPDFTIKYIDGKSVKLSSLKGKVVMLQFTASWCGVCRKEMPHIESDIWKKYKNNPEFVLLGIDYKEYPDKVKAFAEKIKVTYPLTLDESGESFHKYAGPNAGVTRNIIIDRNGKIIFLTRLYDEAEFGKLKNVIKAELAKKQ